VHEQNLGENIFTDEIELKYKRKSGIEKEMRKQLKVNKQAKQEIMENSQKSYFTSIFT